jgi:hypothetical protein
MNGKKNSNIAASENNMSESISGVDNNTGDTNLFSERDIVRDTIRQGRSGQ